MGQNIASSSYSSGRAGDIKITAGNIQLGDDDPTKSLYARVDFLAISVRELLDQDAAAMFTLRQTI